LKESCGILEIGEGEEIIFFSLFVTLTVALNLKLLNLESPLKYV
jgi:hypothetical protein